MIKTDIIVTDCCMHRGSPAMIPFWVNLSAVQNSDVALPQKYPRYYIATTEKMETKKATLLSHQEDLQNPLQ